MKTYKGMKKEEFKKAVLAKSKTLIQSRIDNLEQQIARLENTKVQTEAEHVDLVYKSQNEANHEVSNLLAANLNDAVRNLTRLELLEISGDFSEIVEPSAIVVTNQGIFFVSVSTHNFEVDGKEVMGISTKSPIFIKMVDMKKGDRFRLRDIDYTIEDIF